MRNEEEIAHRKVAPRETEISRDEDRAENPSALQNPASSRAAQSRSNAVPRKAKSRPSRRANVSRGAKLARLSYNALMTAALPVLGVYSLWRRLGQGRSPESLRGMWGAVPDDALLALDAASTRGEENAAPRLWIHAVSVGECAAARIVARALREELSHAKIALSTTTDTGQETARAALAEGVVDATFYFPLDTLVSVRRALQAVRPDAFLCLETELWPNFLHEARRMGAKTFLVNGRVSDNLLRRAPQMGRVWRWTLSGLDAILMRSEFDAKRLEKLGAPLSKIVVTGDVKLDALPQESENDLARARWQRVLASENAPLLVAGSTHPGEEESVLSAWKTLRREFPTLRLLLAPRHIERAATVLEIARRIEPTANLRSQISSENAPPIVVVLDTVGELAEIYAAADVSFVGGSLIERGGHNLLEPVMRGAPVAFGPHVMNFRDAARWALSHQIGAQVEDENALAQALGAWLRDHEARRELARNAREKLRENVGAARRVAQIVARELDAKTRAAT